MAIREIKEGEKVLARHVPASDAWRQALKFFSPLGDYVQVGTWCYPSGEELLAHAHNEVNRQMLWTQEELYIRKGRLRAGIYNSSGTKVAESDAVEGDVLRTSARGHGYSIGRRLGSLPHGISGGRGVRSHVW